VDVRHRGERRQTLDFPLRSLQRAKRLAGDIDRYPELAHALDCGDLDLRRAELVKDLIDEDSVCDWITIAQRVPLAELQEAVVLMGRGNGRGWRTAYLQAIRTADAENATSTGARVYVSLAATQQRAPSVGDQESFDHGAGATNPRTW
jgi:hypothetical protein